jgi:hypothetical protein
MPLLDAAPIKLSRFKTQLAAASRIIPDEAYQPEAAPVEGV